MLSFVVSTLNEEKNLEALFESLVPQLKKEDEIIIVDSYSKDGTVDVARRHGARVILQPKKGVGLAKTSGAKRARNDILVFLDADCILSSGFADKLRSHFIDGDTCIVGGLDLYEADSSLDGFFYNTYSRAVFLTTKIIYRITGKCCVAANNSAYRKKVFFSAGGFRSVICEELDLMKRLPSSKGAVYDSGLVATLSNRRFKEKGFFRTLVLWGWSAVMLLLNKKVDSYDYRKD